MKRILISACLLGLHTRYDGTNSNKRDSLNEKNACFIPVCPEQLGGLPTPREPAEIVNYTEIDVIRRNCRVMTRITKKDVTANFYRGADEAIALCTLFGITDAVLKANSPSCGENGITAVLLKNNGVNIHYEA